MFKSYGSMLYCIHIKEVFNILTAIRRKREALGLTIRELSEMAGVSPNFISEVETGRYNPSFDTLSKLVNALTSYNKRTTKRS